MVGANIFIRKQHLDKWENKSLQILFHEYCSNNFDLEKFQTSITNLLPQKNFINGPVRILILKSYNFLMNSARLIKLQKCISE